MRIAMCVAAVLVLASLSGCVSPEEHYQQGQSYESAGQYDAAVASYLSALESDRNFPGARERARDSGARAVDAHFRAANSAEASRDYRTAADSYGRIDALVGRASRAGVQIPLDPSYAERRRNVFDRGIEQAIADASRLGSQGRWSDALNLYGQAEKDFSPDARQQGLLRDARFHSLLAWGDEELRSGNPKVALDKAEAALKIYRPGTANARAAQALRDAALEAARLYVAMTPVGKADAFATGISPGFLQDLNNILEDEYWTRPPELIATIDLLTVRRELRRLDYAGSVLNDRRATNLGERLNADRVVVIWIDGYGFEDLGSEVARTAPLKGGGTGTYKYFNGARQLSVRARYHIVDPASRRTVKKGRTEVRVDSPITRARYSGNVNKLDLRPGERAWFDAGALKRIDAQLARTAAEELAEDLAEDVYDEIEKTAP